MTCPAAKHFLVHKTQPGAFPQPESPACDVTVVTAELSPVIDSPGWLRWKKKKTTQNPTHKP